MSRTCCTNSTSTRSDLFEQTNLTSCPGWPRAAVTPVVRGRIPVGVIRPAPGRLGQPSAVETGLGNGAERTVQPVRRCQGRRPRRTTTGLRADTRPDRSHGLRRMTGPSIRSARMPLRDGYRRASHSVAGTVRVPEPISCPLALADVRVQPVHGRHDGQLGSSSVRRCRRPSMSSSSSSSSSPSAAAKGVQPRAGSCGRTPSWSSSESWPVFPTRVAVEPKDLAVPSIRTGQGRPDGPRG